MRSVQSAKIRELGDALIASGYISLDDQAKVLGLSRSTTWTILQANHKTSGLSASVINRMLAQPQLPARVRVKILEYVEEKSAGVYGHSRLQVRRFAARLSLERVERIRAKIKAKREGFRSPASCADAPSLQPGFTRARAGSREPSRSK